MNNSWKTGNRYWASGQQIRLPSGLLPKALWMAVCLAGMRLNQTAAESIAEGGSPLYSLAVHESIEGLKNLGKSEPAQGKVCPRCGKVHPPAEAAAHTNRTAAAVPQTNAVDIKAGEYYYCPKCKAYHRRTPTLPVLSSTPRPAIPPSLLGERPAATNTPRAK